MSTDLITLHSSAIAASLGVADWQVFNTLKLFEGGATIPFIARYRKEATGGLNEVQLAAIRDLFGKVVELEKRRTFILESISQQGKLTSELEEALNGAKTLIELEDLYLPYKPKRKTRATMAREKGLEPLAGLLMKQYDMDVSQKAASFINAEKGVNTVEEALQGARDIIAEWVNESQIARKRIRQLFEKEAKIISDSVRGRELEGIHYQNYYEFSENIMRIPSHRLLAIFRGEEEGLLSVSVEPAEPRALEQLERIFIKVSNGAAEQVRIAVKDSYKRLLKPSMENELRQVAKLRADEEAIKVFATNLRELLLASPLGQKRVLAIDPGFRTGCKVVCLDPQGKLLHNETIYPHPPHSEVKLAAAKLKSLVSAYDTEVIAIGNGTAGKETDYFIRKIPFDRKVKSIMVSENGASVYSASAVAREEFPEYDVTVRGAVSIGRRLMDPLAELVKIDPKSIGVGQYQHDVNQGLLQQSLNDTVESCVNQVGVELNTASKQLLSYVSGIGPALAENIVAYRNEHGRFGNRSELMKVKRLGEKAFEQSAGFLRIHGAANPLDASGIHPESYHIVEKMAARLNTSIEELMESETLRSSLKADDFVDSATGLPTIEDILKELEKPGRDPRENFHMHDLDPNINSMEDLKPGMVLNGIVTNVAAFGAFVDIGIHQQGLVHVSQLSDRFVRNPNDVVKLNQQVKVKVLEVDVARKRISLSMKGLNRSS